MTTYRRIAIIGALLILPIAALAGAGSHYLWKTGYTFYAWWPMAGSFALAYLLAWHWQRTHKLLGPVPFTIPAHWTDRDLQAWKLVQLFAREEVAVRVEKLDETQTYADTAKILAHKLAGVYHPGAQHPLDLLTLPEMLTAIELAARDLAKTIDEYLPGGHWLTVRHWRKAKKAVDWYQTANKGLWLLFALFSPIKTAVQYLSSQIGLSRPLQMLQDNLLVWFYTTYVYRVGGYLIELNSGRLRVGAQRYSQLLRAEEQNGPETPEKVREITLTLFGQVKAGKSSLINGLLGEQRARTDVIPATAEIERYELQPPGVPTKLILLDTVGYAHTGPREDQRRATEQAAQQSDLLILTVHAKNPARQADLETLQRLREWFQSKPALKMPPVVAIVTHIDLLSPAMEWKPPYDWQNPRNFKEQNIREATTVVSQQLGDYLDGVVPVCVAPGKVYGIEEWLLPMVLELLDEAHAVGLLRCLHAEVDRHKVRRVLHQLLAAGRQVVTAVGEGMKENK